VRAARRRAPQGAHAPRQLGPCGRAGPVQVLRAGPGQQVLPSPNYNISALVFLALFTVLPSLQVQFAHHCNGGAAPHLSFHRGTVPAQAAQCGLLFYLLPGCDSFSSQIVPLTRLCLVGHRLPSQAASPAAATRVPKALPARHRPGPADRPGQPMAAPAPHLLIRALAASTDSKYRRRQAESPGIAGGCKRVNEGGVGEWSRLRIESSG
jgi:hypothetical protein